MCEYVFRVMSTILGKNKSGDDNGNDTSESPEDGKCLRISVSFTRQPN